MRRRHRGERIVAFTDAVVAIAMTLLVLPLVDVVTSAAHGGLLPDEDLARTLVQSIGPLVGFVISFLVIARLWWAHHALFEQVEGWTTAMVVVDVLWLLSIVLIPWTTSFPTSFADPDWRISLLYVGSMTAASAGQTVLALLIVRDEDHPDIDSRMRLAGNLTTLIAFVVALVLCTAVPATHYLPLLLLAFTGLVDRRVHRRLLAREASGDPA